MPSLSALAWVRWKTVGAIRLCRPPRKAGNADAKIYDQLLAAPLPFTYPAEQDAKSIALARNHRGPGWHRIPAPQSRSPVVVFLPLPAPVVRGSLESGQLPAPVGPLQLYARAPRLPAVWIGRAYRSTAVGRVAAVACSFDRGGVGSTRELGVRHSAIPRTDGRAWLPRRHDSKLAWRHPRLRTRVCCGPPSRVPAHFRAICTDGGHVGSLDQRQPDLERLDAYLPDRGGQGMAGSGSLAEASLPEGRRPKPSHC